MASADFVCEPGAHTHNVPWLSCQLCLNHKDSREPSRRPGIETRDTFPWTLWRWLSLTLANAPAAPDVFPGTGHNLSAGMASGNGQLSGEVNDEGSLPVCVGNRLVLPAHTLWLSIFRRRSTHPLRPVTVSLVESRATVDGIRHIGRPCIRGPPVPRVWSALFLI